MIVSDIYKHVARLGFSDALEDSVGFYSALSRGIIQVASVRPVIKSHVLNHTPPENAADIKSFIPTTKAADDLIYSAENAVAYYFESDAKSGTAYIEHFGSTTWDIIGTVTLQSNGAYTAYKGFITNGGEAVTGEVRIRFTGIYLYSVRNVALYKQLRGGDTADIPAYLPYIRYNMTTLVNDFLSFESPPIAEGAENRRMASGYDTEGGNIILLPTDISGTVKLLYRHKPTLPEYTAAPANDTTEIDLDAELCSILPYIVAAEVLIDDEPDKATYYMNLYREKAAGIERKTRNMSPVTVRNVYGW